MSDETNLEPQARATSVEVQAAEWLQRRCFWVWSAEDQSQFDEWLAQSISHRVAYWRLNAGFERTGRMTALRPVQLVRPAPTSHGRFLPVLRALAVGLVIAAVGGAVSTQLSNGLKANSTKPMLVASKRLCSPMGRRSD